jgi:hypothetical protein
MEVGGVSPFTKHHSSLCITKPSKHGTNKMQKQGTDKIQTHLRHTLSNKNKHKKLQSKPVM